MRPPPIPLPMTPPGHTSVHAPIMLCRPGACHLFHACGDLLTLHLFLQPYCHARHTTAHPLSSRARHVAAPRSCHCLSSARSLFTCLVLTTVRQAPNRGGSAVSLGISLPPPDLRFAIRPIPAGKTGRKIAVFRRFSPATQRAFVTLQFRDWQVNLRVILHNFCIHRFVLTSMAENLIASAF